MKTQMQPKKTKFKRLHKGTIFSCEHRVSALRLQQGAFGLRVLKSGRLTAKQLEQARRKISKARKKKEKQKIWFRTTLDIPITAKPRGLRMGKGKGPVSAWVSKLTAGKIIFQVNWMRKRRNIIRALRRAAKMLPVPTKVWSNRVSHKKCFSIL